MLTDLPADISAEALLNYLSSGGRTVKLCGSHKRNAYEDIGSVTEDDDGRVTVSVVRNGMYDILPECLFHPVDRYENIPANEYRERFAEECERQQGEETAARNFFSGFDRFVIEMQTLVAKVKDGYTDESVVSEIIADNMSAEYRANRFVRRAMKFLPACRNIRGDRTSMTLMLRNVLYDEGLRLEAGYVSAVVTDAEPVYNSSLDDAVASGDDFYLGNEFEEEQLEFRIPYWNEDECSETFLEFVGEMKVFERFVNDYFAGIETVVRFSISTDALPVRLSDDMCLNYLDFNTNI